MPVEIDRGALCLSGLTGTKLKTEIVERYYSFWLSVTTRGKGRFGRRGVYIVEMNAGTGLVKVDETAERILGSAGHALNLKYGPKKDWNKKLRVILVEPLPECRTALRSNILERWPEAD